MEILKQYEEDGYLITEYINGAIVKEVILEETFQELKKPIYKPNDYELKQIQLDEKLEYITTLLEMNREVI